MLYLLTDWQNRKQNWLRPPFPPSPTHPCWLENTHRLSCCRPPVGGKRSLPPPPSKAVSAPLCHGRKGPLLLLHQKGPLTCFLLLWLSWKVFALSFFLFHAAEKGQKEEEEGEGGDLSQLLAPEEGGVEVVGEGQQTVMEEE